jgi:hypothetical protein
LGLEQPVQLIPFNKTGELTALSNHTDCRFLFWPYKAAPREKKDDEHLHGVGLIGLLGALALFSVNYFTSYYYAGGLSLY